MDNRWERLNARAVDLIDEATALAFFDNMLLAQVTYALDPQQSCSSDSPLCPSSPPQSAVPEQLP